MVDKIQKIVEVKFEGNTSELERAAKDLQANMGGGKGAKLAAAAEVSKRSRTDKSKTASEKKSRKDDAKSHKAALGAIKDMLKVDKSRLSIAEKITKESSKQLAVQKKIRQQGGGAGGGGGRGGGGRDRDGGIFTGIGGLIKKASLAAAGAVTALVASHIRSGYQAYAQTGAAKAALQTVTADVEGFDAAAARGTRLGYTEAETARQAIQISRQTGNVRDVSFAQKVSRAGVGLDAGQAGGAMGAIRQAGFSGFQEKGGAGRKEFQKMIALGMESGLEAGRMPEFVDGVTSLVMRQSAATSGDVSGAGIASIMAQFNKSSLSGMQGARGAAVLSKMDQAIRKPGAGAEGEAFGMRAFGFGTPGGTAGFMEARKRMQEGVSGEGNLQSFVNQAVKEFGAGDASTLALEKLTGLTAVQVEAVKEQVDLMNRGLVTETEGRKTLDDILKKPPTIEEKLLKANQTGFTDVVTHNAKIDATLVRIGEEFWDPISKAQEALLTITAENLPTIKKAVEFIAGIAGFTAKVATGKVDVLGGESTGAMIAAASGQAKGIEADVKSGKITAAAGAKDISNTISNLKRKDEEATGGFAGTLGTAVDLAATTAGNLATTAGKGALGLFGATESEQTMALGKGDAQTGEELRATQIKQLEMQKENLQMESQNNKERKAIEEIQRTVAELNAQTAKITNDNIKRAANAGLAVASAPMSQSIMP